MGLVEVKLEPEGRVRVKLHRDEAPPTQPNHPPTPPPPRPCPLSGFGGPRKKPLLINIATSTEVGTHSFWKKNLRGANQSGDSPSLSLLLSLSLYL